MTEVKSNHFRNGGDEGSFGPEGLTAHGAQINTRYFDNGIGPDDVPGPATLNSVQEKGDVLNTYRSSGAELVSIRHSYDSPCASPGGLESSIADGALVAELTNAKVELEKQIESYR